jgi:glycerol-3-phosphate acyltransferase PlsY
VPFGLDPLTVWAMALVLAAIVIGSIPFGLLLARSRGIDLRTIGSGNIGASNVARALGRRWGVVVLLLDAAKGLAPVIAARLLGLSAWWQAVVGLAAVCGHNFSIFLRGRGGKGVATSLGVALGLAPAAAGAAFAVYAALFAALRICSVGSMAGAVAFPLFMLAFGEDAPPQLAFGVAAAVLIIVRHRANIRRLLRGEELKA